MFRSWSNKLPPTVEVCPVHLPGRTHRIAEPAYVKLTPLVEALGQALSPYLDKPFAFFGHSMGALIGFELARHLRGERKPQPEHLFASACRAPQIPRSQPPTYHLTEADFIEELQRLNGTPREVFGHPELLKLMLPILKADFAVCQTYDYVPQPPLDCAITAFGGLDDPDISADHIQAWGEQTAERFSARMFLGDHFFLHTAEWRLLAALASELVMLSNAAR
jgi:medium-chain acyl-[acyl-carrier-protein] hydrolase